MSTPQWPFITIFQQVFHNLQSDFATRAFGRQRNMLEKLLRTASTSADFGHPV